MQLEHALLPVSDSLLSCNCMYTTHTDCWWSLCTHCHTGTHCAAVKCTPGAHRPLSPPPSGLLSRQFTHSAPQNGSHASCMPHRGPSTSLPQVSVLARPLAQWCLLAILSNDPWKQLFTVLAAPSSSASSHPGALGRQGSRSSWGTLAAAHQAPVPLGPK